MKPDIRTGAGGMNRRRRGGPRTPDYQTGLRTEARRRAVNTVGLERGVIARIVALNWVCTAGELESLVATVFGEGVGQALPVHWPLLSADSAASSTRVLEIRKFKRKEDRQ